MEKHQIIERLLTLQSYSPFILICDTLAQTSDILLKAMLKRAKKDVSLIINADLNHFEPEVVVQEVMKLMKPDRTLIGVYHTDITYSSSKSPKSYSPSTLSLLEYMATSVIRVLPGPEALSRKAESSFDIFDFSNKVYNRMQFTVEVEHRRKSGRRISTLFNVNGDTYEFKQARLDMIEDQVDLTNLTTFNLSLSEKQRQDRENVELPYLEAQRGGNGGAILYEYTEVDDYDEDEPFEEDYI